MKHDPKWYVAQVMTGSEQVTASKLTETGIQAIAPVEVLYERRHGKWWPERRTVFPGYVFLCVGMCPRVYYYIDRLPHVIQLLGEDGPEAVPEEQMETVLLLSPDGRDFDVSQGAKIDGKTIITSGPLVPLEDKIVKVNARGRRATVELNVLGNVHQVDVGLIIAPTTTTAGAEALPDTSPASDAR